VSARVINLCESRRKKRGGEKSSSVDGSAEVIDIADARRLKAARKSGESLKGRGFPIDMDFGPDEPGEDFGSPLLGINLELDNPNFPYITRPPKENMNWLYLVMEDEKDDG
jgi:hypothetical protein